MPNDSLHQHDPEPPRSAATRRAVILAVILVSYLMIILDGSIVIAAMPKISAAFRFSLTGEFWVANVYALTFGGFLLLGARMGDILGRRRMLLIGLAVFTGTSLGVACSYSPAAILLFRAIQGFGAAILAPSTLALLATTYPEGPERLRATSYYGAVAGVGGSLGIVLGGLITQWLSWRVGFFINLPIGIALMLGAWFCVSESHRSHGHFDVAGALVSTVGMSAVVYAVSSSATLGWRDLATIASLALGVCLMALFVWVEARARQPIMPLRLFSSVERSGAYATRFVFMGGMMGFWFITARLLQDVMGFSPFHAGLAYLPATLSNFGMALAVPSLSRRFGHGRVLGFGLVTGLIGMAWLSHAASVAPTLWGVSLPMLLVGAGQGATVSPLTVSGVAGVGREDAGAASGLINVAHQVGGALGLSILTVALATGAGHASTPGAALAVGVPLALAASAVMLAIALMAGYLTVVRATTTGRIGKVTTAEFVAEAD